jgi:hypothetical protein
LGSWSQSYDLVIYNNNNASVFQSRGKYFCIFVHKTHYAIRGVVNLNTAGVVNFYTAGVVNFYTAGFVTYDRT